MCTRNSVVVNEVAKKYVGHCCPACASNESTVDYMRFLDPHGAERIDQEVFECSARRHTFVLAEDGLRLLAADGKRCRERKVFQLEALHS